MSAVDECISVCSSIVFHEQFRTDCAPSTVVLVVLVSIACSINSTILKCHDIPIAKSGSTLSLISLDISDAHHDISVWDITRFFVADITTAHGYVASSVILHK